MVRVSFRFNCGDNWEREMHAGGTKLRCCHNHVCERTGGTVLPSCYSVHGTTQLALTSGQRDVSSPNCFFELVFWIFEKKNTLKHVLYYCASLYISFEQRSDEIDSAPEIVNERAEMLANVSLYAIVRLSFVCNVRAPYSGN